MRFKSLFVAGAMALGLLLATPQADAAFVGPVVVSGPVASSSLSGDLSMGDVGAFIGMVQGQGTPFTHTFYFTADPGTLVAAAASVEIPTWVGIENLMVSLNGSAWDSMAKAPVLAGAFANTLVVTGVTTGIAGGNYKADVVLTPIPGAALLLGTALAGVAYVRRRKALAQA